MDPQKIIINGMKMCRELYTNPSNCQNSLVSCISKINIQPMMIYRDHIGVPSFSYEVQQCAVKNIINTVK